VATESDQVKALQQAILERASDLSAEHVSKARMSRDKILDDARKKIKTLEQNELVAAKINADREYQRLVQASELSNQAELDRNRWGLVESVMHSIRHRLADLCDDEQNYQRLLTALLKKGVDLIGQTDLVATLNNEDLSRYQDNWEAMVRDSCGASVTIKLAPKSCNCSGGLRLLSRQGDVMIDNTFEGIMERREDEIHQLIFERLFASLPSRGAVFDG
jgi:V/A-type H+/Na+-transporting ATPase subunit E